MSARRWLAGGLMLAALIALLGFLFQRTQAIDVDAQNRVMLDVRELEKLDAEWNLNILRSHIGINASYDPITMPLARVRLLQARLAAASSMGGGAEPAKALAEVDAALARKEELVEQFKSQNAILRNSLIYFPPALTEFRTVLTHFDGGRTPKVAVDALDAALSELLTAVLRYNLSPNVDLAFEIEVILGRAADQHAALQPAAAETLDQLSRHARAIVDYREREDALETAIALLHTEAVLDRLGRSFDHAFDAVLLERQRYRSFLFAYAGVLLALLLYAAWRLRRSYTIIAQVNQNLKASNETLEQRVAERTAELQAQSERLEELAQHDSLTGLVNYGHFSGLLEHALVRAARRSSTVVVMFIDLDGFKAVNDTHGHATGDLVLVEVAQRVRKVLRKEDALARLGGDEFVILLEEVGTREGAVRVARHALDEIVGIASAGGHPVRISASIGISSAAGRAGGVRPAAALLAEADQAMYQAKQDGKGRFAFSPYAEWPAPAALPRAPAQQRQGR